MGVESRSGDPDRDDVDEAVGVAKKQLVPTQEVMVDVTAGHGTSTIGGARRRTSERYDAMSRRCGSFTVPTSRRNASSSELRRVELDRSVTRDGLEELHGGGATELADWGRTVSAVMAS